MSVDTGKFEKAYFDSLDKGAVVLKAKQISDEAKAKVDSIVESILKDAILPMLEEACVRMGDQEKLDGRLRTSTNLVTPSKDWKSLKLSMEYLGDSSNINIEGGDTDIETGISFTHVYSILKEGTQDQTFLFISVPMTKIDERLKSENL